MVRTGDVRSRDMVQRVEEVVDESFVKPIGLVDVANLPVAEHVAVPQTRRMIQVHRTQTVGVAKKKRRYGPRTVWLARLTLVMVMKWWREM